VVNGYRVIDHQGNLYTDKASSIISASHYDACETIHNSRYFFLLELLFEQLAQLAYRWKQGG